MDKENISVLIALNRIKGLLKKIEAQFEIIFDEMAKDETKIIGKEDYE